MEIFTDLAMEASEFKAEDLKSKKVADKVYLHTIDKGEGKRYYTFECLGNIVRDYELRHNLSKEIAKKIKNLVDFKFIKKTKALVIGLGNRGMTADALGPRVIDRIIVNDSDNKGVSAFTPSVTGLTGMETFDIVKGICDRVNPSVIIAIDTLASRRVSRISSAFQITDSGISPGSGVGNNRKSLNKESLGIPVIAIGVPLVVYAKTLAQDVLSDYLEKADDYHLSKKAVEVIKNSLNYKPSDLVVTPKEIDVIVDASSEIIAHAINFAFWGIKMREEIAK